MTAPSVLFVLPTRGASGGANSVAQEALGMARLGVRVTLAVNQPNLAEFRKNYPELEGRVPVLGYDEAVDLAAQIAGFGVVVATTNASMHMLAAARAALGEAAAGPRYAYYVQDYEPLFYEPDSPRWEAAFSSYTAMPDTVLFAKTQWLCRITHENHGVQVHKVEPSIDHDIFHADLGRDRSRPTIVAMLRPQTPRRAPHRTVRVFTRLAAAYADRIGLVVFGATAETLGAAGLALPAGVTNHGLLRRFEVPQVLRAADLFLDLSDYQAFGRTALEGMACGCVPVVPLFGGSSEFARHRRNAYVVDTRSDEAILDAVHHFVGQAVEARLDMVHNALETAAGYTIEKAALSELRVFQEMTAKPAAKPLAASQHA